MPRALTAALNNVMLGVVRAPRYKVLVYDLRSTEGDATPSTIGDVVLGNPLPAIVGPRDFTSDVIAVDVEERAGDYISGGITASSVGLTVVDSDATLDPVDGSNGRWLKQRNVVRVIEGDAQVPEADWKITFTGKITGQPGLVSGRTQGTRELTVKAVGREADFIKQKNKVSAKFPEATTYFSMAESIAINDMGLAAGELNFPTFGSNQTKQRVTQFVLQPPIVSLAQIGLIDGLLPRFDGEGKLGFIGTIITKGPARSYTSDDGLIQNVGRPPVDLNGFNEVKVEGLDPDLKTVKSGRQSLATASMTLGYFTTSKKIPVRFSEDNRMQATSTRFRKVSSINDGLIPVGKETWVPDTDPISGFDIGGTIKVKSPFKPAVTVLTTVTSIAAAAIPDTSLPTGGPVTPTGKVEWSFVLAAIMTFMQTQNTGQYEITGRLVEFMYDEFKATARVKGVKPEDRRSVTIENHLLDSQTACDQTATRALNLAQARQNVRDVEAVHDLILEPDDIFEYDGRRYMNVAINRTLTRDENADSLARYSCFEVTPGVFP